MNGFFRLVFDTRREVVRAVLVTVGCVLASGFVWAVVLTILEPWAHSLYLWPTLSGGWQGDVADNRGGRSLLRLELHGDNEYPPIGGSATTCDPRHGARETSIAGSTGNWRGTRFTLTGFAIGEEDRNGGRLSRIHGTWQGDVVELTATLEHQLPTETVRSPVRFTLRRGTRGAFDAACRELAGGAER